MVSYDDFDIIAQGASIAIKTEERTRVKLNYILSLIYEIVNGYITLKTCRVML